MYDIPRKDLHLRRGNSRRFKANKVAKMDEEVASDIKGCFRSITLNLKLPKMTGHQYVINILATLDTMRTDVAGSDQTDEMIQVRTSFPSKGLGVKNTIPVIPLVIATFIIMSGLITLLVYVPREVGNEIQ